MNYIPDPIERLEVSAERWAEDNMIGDMFKCGCGKMCNINEGQPIDSNPYAIPVCHDCFKNGIIG